MLVSAAFLSGIFGARASIADEVLPEPKACSLLMQRMATHDGLPQSKVNETWFCDVTLDPDNSHPDWWVIGLRSFRQCGGICSNLRGWFGVNRRSGEIREWDMSESVPGDPIRD